jgi:hypothetical protein
VKAEFMKMNVGKCEVMKKLFDPVLTTAKAYSAIHALAEGKSHARLWLSALLEISNAVIGIMAVVGLFFSWMKRKKNKSELNVLKKYEKLRSKSLCPFARKAKLYGGCVGKSQDIKTAVRSIMPRLIELTEFGKQRKLDGFVVELPADRFANNLIEFCTSFNCFLRELSKHDPSEENCFKGNILRKDWQFTFNHTRFFVTTFAPFYNPRHPRFSKLKNSAFIFLQPDYSFDNHGISRRNSQREKVKDNIRQAFQEAGSGYDIGLVKQPLEALKYIKALDVSDPSLQWWKLPC